MSDRLPRRHNISNEEVIDRLTRGLVSPFDMAEFEAGNFVEEEPNEDDLRRSAGDTQNTTDNPQLSDSEDSEEEKTPSDASSETVRDNSDAESVDEESIKESEVDLTDDQKAQRRVEAEELKNEGNEAFKVGEFEKSIEKYTEGLRICPVQFARERSILYCNRSAAQMKREKYKPAIKDCNKAIKLDEKYLKAYYRRALSYEASDELEKSLADYQKILELDPSHKEAQAAVIRLPPIIEEKNEKIKREMFVKLKDLGNMILRPFGLSTENFQMEQDPESKGYKINFKQ